MSEIDLHHASDVGPAYFAGRWQMFRIIENVEEGVIGEFWGDAVFSPDGAGLRCVESGVLRFRGEDYHADRTALWRFPERGRIEVQYEDGRPFHDFVLDDPRAEHQCGDDRYRVSYRFHRDAWLSRWEVAGPRKDYVMTSRYRRTGAEAPPAWPEIALHG
ncbi:DUF6314 family protein [Paralimibaculum aggregatum]|uniref:DUF6314 family protein n=1 Tax=Paralimibaculum aggregatum TaxID=3036245 RepID=A0ABQ6LS15_9RHOB|nr:DUF6314 family protein [Limibaculum sp. NKW23]GMG84878.1 DUF6314 family protein [Limibaculum sp. NKW23]